MDVISCKQRENLIEAYKMSFDELQELFLLSHDDGTVDDEELLLLHEEFSPKNPDLSCGNYTRLELEDMNDSDCLTQFRVKKSDSPILAEALQIPESFTCYQRSVESGMEGLCILLRRLSYPCRYSDVVCCDVLDFVYDTHSHRITRWNPTVLSLADPQIYSDAFAAKGAALQNCFGFIDGAICPIRRPGEQQRILYNGHKKFHSLIFQAVALPNGPIGNFYGPAGQ